LRASVLMNNAKTESVIFFNILENSKGLIPKLKWLMA